MAKRGKTNMNAGKGGKQISTKMEEIDIKTYEDMASLRDSEQG